MAARERVFSEDLWEEAGCRVNGSEVFMDHLTKEQRHRSMSHIRCKNTSIEVLLCKELRKRGYGYRKNYKELPGKPDIVLTKYKIAIFCDGEFFHGKDWANKKARLQCGNNPEYWIGKIERNMKRDEANNTALLHLGWIVLRFWGNEIKSDTISCINEIEDAIVERKSEKL